MTADSLGWGAALEPLAAVGVGAALLTRVSASNNEGEGFRERLRGAVVSPESLGWWREREAARHDRIADAAVAQLRTELFPAPRRCRP